MSPIRLARFLARAGVTSRRGAAELVRSGRVLVNGRPPLGPGDPVEPGSDRVTLDGRLLSGAPILWLALHKPAGYVTSRKGTPRYPSVFRLLAGAPAALVTVGRLDVYSEGLLLCTTDGDAAHRLMHPRWQVPRRYLVRVAGALGAVARDLLDRGVPIGEGPQVRPERWRFRAVGSGGGRGGELELQLREGRSRVVRKVAAHLGLGVRRLVRVGYGPVTLGRLAPGSSRPLSRRELVELYRAVGLPLPPEA